MIIEYKNFKISQDQFCYILEEYGPKDKKKGLMDIVLKNTYYPGTLGQALASMKEKIRAKGEERIKLDNIVAGVEKSHRDFLKDIILLLNK